MQTNSSYSNQTVKVFFLLAGKYLNLLVTFRTTRFSSEHSISESQCGLERGRGNLLSLSLDEEVCSKDTRQPVSFLIIGTIRVISLTNMSKYRFCLGVVFAFQRIVNVLFARVCVCVLSYPLTVHSLSLGLSVCAYVCARLCVRVCLCVSAPVWSGVYACVRAHMSRILGLAPSTRN